MSRSLYTSILVVGMELMSRSYVTVVVTLYPHWFQQNITIHSYKTLRRYNLMA